MNDVSGNEEYEETFESTEYPNDPIDYSGYFENLQILGILLITVILGSAMAICFTKGFKK